MKNLVFTLIALITLFVLSCDVDPTEPTVNNDCPSGLCLNVEINVGNEDFEIDQTYTAPNGVTYNLDLINFYISRLTLIDDAGNEGEVDSFSFFTTATDNLSGNNASEQRVYNLPNNGTYNKVRLGVGLYPDQNATDGNAVPIGHPLHVFNGTFWSWATNYRFVMFEGTSDSLGTDQSILLHAGLDTFFHERTFTIDAFNAANVSSKSLDLSIDLNDVLSSPGSIDLASERRIHGGPTTWALADKFLTNFSEAIKVTD